jgi:hypothetical protein
MPFAHPTAIWRKLPSIDWSSEQLLAVGASSFSTIPERFGDVINVKRDFGAKGDGYVDDTSAVRNAVRAAVGRGAGGSEAAIFFPPGKYRITQSGVLQDTNSPGTQGPKLFGSHHWASQIWLDTSGGSSEMWFYDNGATQRLQFGTFEDLMFVGSGSWANGFRMYSTGHEQSPHFHNCRFHNLKIAHKFDGSGNSDRMVCTSCYYYGISQAIVYLNNAQSVAHQLIGCDFQVSGDLIFVGTGGGGSMIIVGGSISMDAGAAPHWLLHVDPNADGTALGSGNSSFGFYGVKLEANEVYSGLVSVGALPLLTASFISCDLSVSQGGLRTAVDIVSQEVLFKHCRMNGYFNYVLNHNPTNVSRPDYSWSTCGRIIFDECWIDDGLPGRVSRTNGGGIVIAKDCQNQNIMPGERRAVDFTIGWLEAGGSQGFQARMILIAGDVDYLPGNNNSALERYVVLPPNAMIKSIRVYKPAGGANGTNYQLKVGNGDKSVVYGSSAVAAQSAVSTIQLDNLWIGVGSSSNDRTVKIWEGTGNNGMDTQNGGYAIVEYI